MIYGTYSSNFLKRRQFVECVKLYLFCELNWRVWHFVRNFEPFSERNLGRKVALKATSGKLCHSLLIQLPTRFLSLFISAGRFPLTIKESKSSITRLSKYESELPLGLNSNINGNYLSSYALLPTGAKLGHFGL